jgi:hypothetical protein
MGELSLTLARLSLLFFSLWLPLLALEELLFDYTQGGVCIWTMDSYLLVMFVSP